MRRRRSHVGCSLEPPHTAGIVADMSELLHICCPTKEWPQSEREKLEAYMAQLKIDM